VGSGSWPANEEIESESERERERERESQKKEKERDGEWIRKITRGNREVKAPNGQR